MRNLRVRHPRLERCARQFQPCAELTSAQRLHGAHGRHGPLHGVGRTSRDDELRRFHHRPGIRARGPNGQLALPSSCALAFMRRCSSGRGLKTWKCPISGSPKSTFKMQTCATDFGGARAWEAKARIMFGEMKNIATKNMSEEAKAFAAEALRDACAHVGSLIAFSKCRVCVPTWGGHGAREPLTVASMRKWMGL